jgi:hypothetical protein
VPIPAEKLPFLEAGRANGAELLGSPPLRHGIDGPGVETPKTARIAYFAWIFALLVTMLNAELKYSAHWAANLMRPRGSAF